MREKEIQPMNAKERTALREPRTLARPLRLARIEDVLERMNEVHDKLMRRAFEIFEESGARQIGQDLSNWLRAEAELLQPVRLDLTEGEESFHVTAEVPGFTEQELQVALEPRRLTITARHEMAKEEKKERLHRRERTSQEILRVVELPGDVDANRAQATLQNGVLEIEIPKMTVARKVPVQPAA